MVPRDQRYLPRLHKMIEMRRPSNATESRLEKSTTKCRPQKWTHKRGKKTTFAIGRCDIPRRLAAKKKQCKRCTFLRVRLGNGSRETNPTRIHSCFFFVGRPGMTNGGCRRNKKYGTKSRETRSSFGVARRKENWFFWGKKCGNFAFAVACTKKKNKSVP